MEYLMLFLFSFVNIFVMGFQSQIVRDQIIAIAFCNTWLLAIVQFFSTRWIVDLDPAWGLLSFGSGSSLGIICSILFYRWFIPKFESWRARRKNSILWGTKRGV